MHTSCINKCMQYAQIYYNPGNANELTNTALTNQVSKIILRYIYFWQDGWKEALSYFLSFNNNFLSS